MFSAALTLYQNHEHHDHNENNEHKKKDAISGLLQGLFPDLKLDDDKIVIILLIIILARNGSDIKLLLALGYLLM